MPIDVDDIETFDELEDDQPEDLDQTQEEGGEREEDVAVEDQPNDENQETSNDEEEGLDSFTDEDLDDAFSSTEDSDESDETTDEEDQETVEDQENTDEEANEETEEVSFVEEFGSQLGLSEDELQDHEDTWDDALEVARKGAQTIAEREMNNFFEQYPDVEQYAQYRANGGDPDTFREEVLNAPSYDELELEGNESTQERVVREKLQEVEGLSDERIDSRVDRYKSAGILKSEAEDAKEILSERQEQKREQLVEQQKEEAEKRKQQQLEEQKKYKQTIQESDNLAGLQLPETQKDDFESYLFEPVDDEGMTQAEKDYQNMSRDEALALYYLTYQGLDNLDELVDNKASTKKAQKLSDRLKKTKSRDVSDKSENSGSRRKSDDADLTGFNLDEQIG